MSKPIIKVKIKKQRQWQSGQNPEATEKIVSPNFDGRAMAWYYPDAWLRKLFPKQLKNS